MKQIWKLNTFKGIIPKGVTMVLMRDGTMFSTNVSSSGFVYSWNTSLWKKYDQGCDIVAYHVEGDYR